MKVSELIKHLEAYENLDIMIEGLDTHFYPMQLDIKKDFYGPKTEAVLIVRAIEESHSQHTVNQFDKIKALNEIAREKIKPSMPKGMGFIFLMFDYGEKGNCFYAASADRADCLNLMKEFIKKQTQ